MPISGISVFDPLMRIYATGWLYRKAVHGGRSKLVLVGMWLIFAPALLLVGMPLSQSLGYYPVGWRHNPIWIECLEYALSLGYALLCAVILWKVTSRCIRTRQIPPNHCAECGYDLTGLSVPRCPECGTRFHPDDLDTRPDVP
jgi:hypothetical protein